MALCKFRAELVGLNLIWAEVDVALLRLNARQFQFKYFDIKLKG